MVPLGMIYRFVRNQEKKLAKYGVGALRANLQQSQTDVQQSGRWTRLRASLILPTNANAPVTRSNGNTQPQSRAVMHKAFGYFFAWLLSYGFFVIVTVIQISTGDFPLPLIYLVSIFAPLQGLFNLIIYMFPKVISAKSKKRGGGENVSWCEAIKEAFRSRGNDGKRKGPGQRSNLRGNDRPLRTRMDNDRRMATFQFPIRTNRQTPRRREPQAEEEKREIQPPQNTVPRQQLADLTYARND